MDETLLMTQSNRETWDKYVKFIPEATLYHSWDWLNYEMSYGDVAVNETFIIFNNQGDPLAVVPLFYKEIEGRRVMTGANPLGVPAMVALKPSGRRSLQEAIFKIIFGFSKLHKIDEIQLIWHPVNLALCGGEALSHTGMFEPLKYGFKYKVENSIFLELSKTEEELLSEVSKYHRRHIKRGIKRGMDIITYNNDCDVFATNKAFDSYVELHRSMTHVPRSIKTYEEMRSIINLGGAALFVCFHEKQPLSYLLCGQFAGKLAFGWSQCNVKQFEKEFSPRHLLEWSAILHSKNEGFSFYELGERYFGEKYTKKELSISIFKERFGGCLFPKVFWHKEL